jgi:signal transduction histidine kinase
MGKVAAAELEGRILLLPPTKRDAAAAVTVFQSVGLALTVCQDIVAVCAEIKRGAALAIVSDEAILKDDGRSLARLLKEQPPWSDFPLVVLIAPNQTATAAHDLEEVGHMMLVQRPIEIRSLVSTVQAALRDRRRQYARREEFVERERQAQALRENDRHKDEFLAMLAHELRNPLAAVNNAVMVLKKSADQESLDWAGDVVERQVRQLCRLIDDLLDVSRITSGKIRLRRDHVDASCVLDQAIESARPLIDERRHTLTVSVERGKLPLHVDVTRIGQIAANLLTNAAKYTESGGNIELSARQEGTQVAISVRDNGMGIPPEKLPEMFKLFAQGDRSLARSEGGLGIGLTIVQKLAEMHGGSVEAHSEGPGRGSEFIVRLPIAPEAKVPTPEQRRERTAIRKRARILVVDDNMDTALGMVKLLKLLGNEVVAAHSGPTAIEVAHSFQPEFVLLDIGLPGMDGYQVASALRDDEAHRDSVIIAVSGYGQEADRRRSQAAGFDHHLVKPVDFDALISLIGQPA